MSATTELQLKYQGSEYSRSKTEKVYKQTYIGKESLVDAKIATLSIGSFTSGKGYLSSWRKNQDDGIFYNLQIEYTTSYSNDNSNLDSADYGKKSASLSVRNIQMPLEHHEKYLTNWNHYLIGKEGCSTPSFWQTAKNAILTGDNDKNYKWIKSLGERPDQRDENGKKWVILEQPQKKGYEYYDLACFVVTETTKHGSASSAGNSVQKKINTITKPSEDFGISGGNWKLDQATVSYQGGHWLATKVFTRSGDDSGWDTDLYK